MGFIVKKIVYRCILVKRIVASSVKQSPFFPGARRVVPCHQPIARGNLAVVVDDLNLTAKCVVPLPPSALLFFSGVVGLGILGWRRRSA
jgi:hypothetical protein